MSQASQLLSSGLTALLATNGESVSFRGADISALVDRDQYTAKSDPRLPVLTEKQFSQVMIPKDALTAPPRCGEYLTDEFSYKHRIQSVRFTGNGWRCQCEVS